ncbi:MAG: hypothetical protein IJL66_04875 [Lachnospiraceae bacterium]|nr:hypothetical protein [Lachnospiraceae bacterium]
MTHPQRTKREIGPENVIFLVCLLVFFGFFAVRMGMLNMINTLMNTAYELLIDTVFFLLALCVVMGALAGLLSEFGVVAMANRLLNPLMQPVFGMPGAASVGVVVTFLSDNPAVLSLADDSYFRSLFKKYQFPALTNLGTAYGMGLIVCTYMISIAPAGTSFVPAVAVGFLGAVIGSVISTRMMLRFTKKIYGTEAREGDGSEAAPPTVDESGRRVRPIRDGNVGNRFLGAILEGGEAGVKMGLSIIPGVLIVCTVVLMLTNGPGEGGVYTGAAYEGVGLLTMLAEKLEFILRPLFGFTSPEAIGVPITALGAAGAAIGIARKLIGSGLACANDIAVFTAMCMCWSGYLSTHVSMMNALHSKELIGKSLICHTVGGFCAGVAAHWLYVLIEMI